MALGFGVSSMSVVDRMFAEGDKHPAVLHLKKFLNWLPYLRAKNTLTTTFDAELKTSLSNFQTYHRLTVTDGSLNNETYSKIGAEMTDPYLIIVTTNDTVFERLLFDTRLAATCATWNSVPVFVPADKFIGWGNAKVSKKNCFDYAW